MKHLQRFYLLSSAKSLADFIHQVRVKSHSCNNPNILDAVNLFISNAKTFSFCDCFKLNYITRNEITVSLNFKYEIIDGLSLYRLIIVLSDEY